MRVAANAGEAGTHWNLQWFPALCGSLAIAVAGVAARRLFGRRELGIVVALLLMLDPVLSTYSVRVKPFTFDVLVISIILYAGTFARERRWLRVLIAAVAAPLSFTSLIVTVPMVAIDCLHGFRDRRVRSAVLVFVASAMVTVFFLAAPRMSPALREFWRSFYLPLDATIVNFARVRLFAFFTSEFAGPARWLALLIPFGLFRMWCFERTRRHAVVMTLSLLLLLAASAAHRYPLGGERTDLFLHPLFAFAIAGALLGSTGRWQAVGRSALAAVVLLLILQFRILMPVYPVASDRDAVAGGLSLLGSGDELLIYPFSSWAVGYYGAWPVRFVETDVTTNAFYAIPERGETTMLMERVGGVDFRDDRRVLEVQLDRLVSAKRPRTITLIATSADPAPLQHIVERLTHHGYSIQSAQGMKGAAYARLLLEERR